jgi:hypothetical protein
MPLMSFQQAVDSNLEICQLLGSVSISLGATREGFKSKEHDITYTVSRLSPRITEVNYDSGDLANTITQKTFWNQVLDDLGAEFTELNIATRVPIVQVPPKFDFDFNLILMVQTKSGNFTKSLRERFNLHGIRNPYLLMRNELIERELWRRDYSRKLRGILKTTNLAGYDGKKLKGWENFVEIPEGHRFPPAVNQLNDALILDKWWQDNGIPVRMLGAINSNEIEAILYMLQRRRVVITA